MPKLTMVLNKVGKTINLAKTNTYQIPRKPPLNTLIFEKLPEARCGDKITSCIKLPPHTKPVKICTKEDLQAFYCPPPCDCEMKAPPLTMSQKVAKTTMLLIKSLIVGGLVYYTWSEGLWSDTEHTAIIYDKLTATSLLFKQAVKALLVGGIIYYTYKEGLWSDAFRSSCFLGKFVEACPKEDDTEFNEFADLKYNVIEEPGICGPFIPRTGYMLYRLGRYWNQLVIFLFWIVVDGPHNLWDFAFKQGFKPKKSKLVIKECPTE